MRNRNYACTEQGCDCSSEGRSVHDKKWAIKLLDLKDNRNSSTNFGNLTHYNIA
jgi:hypothetical protein